MTPNPNPLPPVTFTDPSSVLVWLGALASVIVGVIVAIHPGFTEPPVVTAILPAASFIVAAAVVIFHTISRKAVRRLSGTLGVTTPNWNSPTSVAGFLGSLVAYGVALLTAIHPGFSLPPSINALLPTLLMLAGGVVSAFEIAVHHAALVASVTAEAARRSS